MLFLQDHSVSTAFAAKIYRQYGNESIPKVKENPFAWRMISGELVLRRPTALHEAWDWQGGNLSVWRSGIMYTLSELADEGHVMQSVIS